MTRRVEELNIRAVTSAHESPGIGLYDVTINLTIPAESVAEAVSAVVEAIGELA